MGSLGKSIKKIKICEENIFSENVGLGSKKLKNMISDDESWCDAKQQEIKELVYLQNLKYNVPK